MMATEPSDGGLATRRTIATNELATHRPESLALDSSTLRSRVAGYVVDMVIFSALTMVVVVLAGFLLLLMTDFAEQDASDRQLYTFLAMIGLGVPIAWTLLNLVLLTARGQTGGQYVAGVRTVAEEGVQLRKRDAATWWFCFNPLLFSWPMALVAGLPLALVISLVLSRLTIAAFVALVLLCLLAPIVAFVSAGLDRRHQALHDRIARVIVVPER
jgi:hypothetical protein